MPLACALAACSGGCMGDCRNGFGSFSDSSTIDRPGPAKSSLPSPPKPTSKPLCADAKTSESASADEVLIYTPPPPKPTSNSLRAEAKTSPPPSELSAPSPDDARACTGWANGSSCAFSSEPPNQEDESFEVAKYDNTGFSPSDIFSVSCPRSRVCFLLYRPCSTPVRAVSAITCCKVSSTPYTRPQYQLARATANCTADAAAEAAAAAVAAAAEYGTTTTAAGACCFLLFWAKAVIFLIRKCCSLKQNKSTPKTGVLSSHMHIDSS